LRIIRQFILGGPTGTGKAGDWRQYGVLIFSLHARSRRVDSWIPQARNAGWVEWSEPRQLRDE